MYISPPPLFFGIIVLMGQTMGVTIVIVLNVQSEMDLDNGRELQVDPGGQAIIADSIPGQYDVSVQGLHMPPTIGKRKYPGLHG